MSGRPQLLFISPVLPSRTGNGLAMRQAMLLEALAPDYRIHLHVARLFPPAEDSAGLRLLRTLCASVTVQEVELHEDPQFRAIAGLPDVSYRLAALASYRLPQLMRYATAEALAEAARRQTGRCFQAVHVARLYLAPFAQPFRQAEDGSRPWMTLDLDDYESETHRRLAALYSGGGDTASAWIEQAEATKYARVEEAELATFDQVLVASDLDRHALAERLPQVSLAHVPNAVLLPPRHCRRQSVEYRLLFVGSMGYLPNDDAARFFISEVLPRLRARADRPVRLTIAGSFPSPRLCALARAEGVTVTGAVSDLAEYYETAHIAIAPLRAGGGTRIKILEAFAHRCPVVATRLAVEGIDADDGKHLLLADDAEEFASASLRLLRDLPLQRRLAAHALVLVRRTYIHTVVARKIRALMKVATNPSAPE